MDSSAHSPENLEERLIFWSIVGTWGFYLLGALYLLAPVLGWLLFALVAWRLFTGDYTGHRP